jgi:hypothetical protein
MLRAFLRLKTNNPATSATTAKPPTTPPIMAPILEDSFAFSSVPLLLLGVGVPITVGAMGLGDGRAVSQLLVATSSSNGLLSIGPLAEVSVDPTTKICKQTNNYVQKKEKC